MGKIPTKVYIGFYGETTTYTNKFNDLDDAVAYVRKKRQENDEIRRERPETPQLVFWMNDVFLDEKGDDNV